jgi:hypothetical protein
MFGVCANLHAHCFRVVRRSIFDRRALYLAPEKRLCQRNGTGECWHETSYYEPSPEKCLPLFRAVRQ